MSQTPEAPLLSPERLAEIQSIANRSGGLHYTTLADYYREDVPALLAERAAYRQQVATEIAALLYGPGIIGEYRNNVNSKITAAAARLGIELPR